MIAASVYSATGWALAADALVTPVLLRMSPRTRWVCRAAALLLLLSRVQIPDLALRRKLEAEAAAGIGLMFLALRGRISHRWFENLYLFASGVGMLANSLMTEVGTEN